MTTALGKRLWHERPRERALVHGVAALADRELVALILGGGRALERGAAVLECVGGLAKLDGMLPQELAMLPGVGMASATALCAAAELGRRIAASEMSFAAALRQPSDVADYLRARLRGATQELFVILGLDARQRVRLVRTVAMGSLAHVDVHPREVFRPLIRAGMHSVILVHNHPSGDAEPSQADIELTRRLGDVGLLVGVPVLDHFVVTSKRTVSLASLGVVIGAR